MQLLGCCNANRGPLHSGYQGCDSYSPRAACGVSPTSLPKVHKETSKPVKPVNGLNESDVEAWQLQIIRLLSATTPEARKKQYKAAEEDSGPRAASYDVLRALDHTLSLHGSGLSAFVPAADCEWERLQSSTLQKNEVRFHIPWAGPWPGEGDVPAEARASGTKSVIKNMATGQKRFELADFSGPRPCLCLNIDEGSKGFSAVWFLCAGMRGRILWLRDPSHRAWRDFDLTVTHLGWKSTILEGLFCNNLRFAPWMSESFWAQIKETLEKWIEQDTVDDEIFVALYSKICQDKGRVLDEAYGTREHMQAILIGMRTDALFLSKGTKIAMRSFWGWPRAMQENLIPSWHTLLAILCFFGIKEGWWGKTGLPIWERAPTADVIGAGSSGSTGGTDDDFKLKSMREQCTNSMHAAAVILSDPARLRRIRVAAYACEKQKHFHFAEQKVFSEPGGIARYYVRLAKGDYGHQFVGMFSQLSDRDFLAKVGVGLASASCLPPEETPSDNPAVVATCADEADMVKDLWDFIVHLASNRLLSLGHYNLSCPGLFALFVSESARDRELGLQRARECWEALEFAEEAAKTNSIVARLLAAIPWANFVLVREVLLSLRQFNFSFLTKSAEGVATAVFGGFGQSCVNENAFNRIKAPHGGGS